MANRKWQDELNDSTPSRLPPAFTEVALGNLLAALCGAGGGAAGSVGKLVEYQTTSSNKATLANGKTAVNTVPEVEAYTNANVLLGVYTQAANNGTATTGKFQLTDQVGTTGVFGSITFYSSDTVASCIVRYVPSGGAIDIALQALAANAA